MTLGLFDDHRDHGSCYELEGVILEGGVWGTPEGHAKRRELVKRFAKRSTEASFKLERGS